MNKDTKPVVVTIGNPNTGKSTLFNSLTGLRQQVSNFPGVTVEQVSGAAKVGHTEVLGALEVKLLFHISCSAKFY